MMTAASVFLPVVTYSFLQFFFNRSDGRVNRASISGSVDSGFDSESIPISIPISSPVKPMTLKLVFTASLLDIQH